MSREHAEGIRCYRCGGDLARLTLPIARLDLCPACGVELHVCRMCTYFQPSAPGGCIEEDAEEVHDKTHANFCEYYRPGSDAFDGAAQKAETRARNELAALFGEGDDDAGQASDADDPLAKARALFDR